MQYSFSVPADAFVSGRYFGDGKTYPGVVYVRDKGLPLEWHIKNPLGTETSVLFGLPGDTIINQGDLDCDGITDFIVVRERNDIIPTFKFWYVALSSGGGGILENIFGRTGDRLAVKDLDGDGCDEMVAIRDGFIWFSKKLFSTELRQVQWGIPGDIPLLPQDLNFDGVPDYIIVRPGATSQTAFIRFSEVFFMMIPLGDKSTIPSVAQFWNEGPNFSWQDRSKRIITVRAPNGAPFTFPWGSSSESIIRPDGTVVQPNESGRFGIDEVVDDTNGARCDKMYPNHDGKDKFVWKPVSHGTPTNSSILLPADPYKDKLPVAAFNLWHEGDIVGRGRFTGYKHPDRPTYHLPKNGDEYPQNVTIALSLRNGQVHCINIPDPSIRWD